MHFQQFYLQCLAHASYLVGDGDECAIVDPQRDVDLYVDEAARLGLSIRWVIETHLHADFVSGHGELAARTGAEILLGAGSGAAFPHRSVSDGERLKIGNIELVAMATPGHTPESISWVIEEEGRPTRVLTGDTMFIGDVGRPDLAGGRGFTSAQMAETLYDSLHEKLLLLPDFVEVWPAHGAGSACGKNMSKERSSTIGVQRRVNYALQPMTKDAFVTMLTADLAEAPPYFSRDAELNRSGPRLLTEISAPPLTPAAAWQQLGEGAVALDVRDATAYGVAHIPGAINIGLGGQFASWCGTLLSFDTPVVIVAEGTDQAREAIVRMARVGMENVVGFVDGGMLAWTDGGFPVGELPQLAPVEVQEMLAAVTVIDVRGPGEYGTGHVPGARNVPLNRLPVMISELDPSREHAVICAGGYRSSAAASLLARHGFTNLINIAGGTSAWQRAGLQTES